MLGPCHPSSPPRLLHLERERRDEDLEELRGMGGLGLGDDLVESTCPIYHMGVFKNRGTPKSSILIGFSNYKPSILGYPLFLETPIFHHISTLPSHGKWVFGDFLQQRIVGNSRQTVYSRYLRHILCIPTDYTLYVTVTI